MVKTHKLGCSNLFSGAIYLILGILTRTVFYSKCQEGCKDSKKNERESAYNS